MLEKLPNNIRQQAKDACKQFRENPYHPSLRFKKVHNTESIYAVRININYRAVGVIIVWFWIGPHTEYEKLLDAL